MHALIFATTVSILTIVLPVPYGFAQEETSAVEPVTFEVEGDIKAGKKVFKKCKACHQVKKEKNGVGPHLINVLGRKGGSIEGYKYSKALVEKDIVWTPEAMAEFLKKPKVYIKGTSMGFGGLKKDIDITNLIAYLNSVGK